MPNRNRRRRQRRTQQEGPTPENVCFPCDEHHHRLLKMAGFDTGKIPTWNVTTVDGNGDEIDTERMYLFDDTQIKKFEAMKWDVCERRETTIKGVYAASLEMKPADIKGAHATRNLDKLRKDFVAFCSSFMDKQAVKAKSEMETARRNLQSATSQFVTAMRHKNECERTYNLLRGEGSEKEKKFLTDLDGILKIEKVTGMNVAGTQLEVFTDTLYCLNERTGTEHEIGKFRFTFDFDSGAVRFFNRTRKIDGNDPAMNAPHVYDNGEACLGTAAQPFAELFARHDCLGLVSFAIQFIESANQDDIGEFVTNWPESKRSKQAQAKARASIVVKDKETGKLTVRKKITEHDEESGKGYRDDLNAIPVDNSI